MALFALIPFSVLGVLLAYIAAQHASLARVLRGRTEVTIAGLVVFLAILTGNLAIGFIAGAIFFHLWKYITNRVIKISTLKQKIG